MNNTHRLLFHILGLNYNPDMLVTIGNNQYYVGNGLTKDAIQKSPNQYSVVETLNFEQKEINLLYIRKW
jgi:hypothetical protein